MENTILSQWEELCDFFKEPFTEEGVAELKKMTSFSKHYSVYRLPENIGFMTNLIHIQVKGVNLVSLPESFGNLVNLKHLLLDNNSIAGFPSCILKCTKLETLSMRECGLQTLPEGILGMENLKLLDLRDNRLRTVPEGLWDMKVDLLIGENFLKGLPEKVRKDFNSTNRYQGSGATFKD